MFEDLKINEKEAGNGPFKKKFLGQKTVQFQLAALKVNLQPVTNILPNLVTLNGTSIDTLGPLCYIIEGAIKLPTRLGSWCCPVPRRVNILPN